MPRSKIETGTLEHESLEADDASGGLVEYLLDSMLASVARHYRHKHHT
jgi:hypothetical protein